MGLYLSEHKEESQKSEDTPQNLAYRCEGTSIQIEIENDEYDGRNNDEGVKDWPPIGEVCLVSKLNTIKP